MYEIDHMGNINQYYRVKPSTIKIKTGNDTSLIGSYLILQFRYPSLEVTYEKSFFVLDMDNWLGEVGGLAFLLFLLQRALLFVVKAVMIKLDKFSYMNLGKEYDQEALVF